MRWDPFRNFRFRVKFADGKDYVAGVSKVSGLKRTTEVIRHRDGGSPGTSRKLPGRTEYEAVTPERGCTTDTAFEEWANRVWSLRNSAGGLETSLKDFRRDLLIDVFDEGGQKVLSYSMHKAWVSDCQDLPSTGRTNPRRAGPRWTSRWRLGWTRPWRTGGQGVTA
ncbi:phage tail protein [Streptomyces sp. NPDC006290]|uniref:phage tail protein n=1 Tax=Streptomyces sp. NPDC006290 TaxID=3156745 RepID=UPI0033BAC158